MVMVLTGMILDMLTQFTTLHILMGTPIQDIHIQVSEVQLLLQVVLGHKELLMLLR
jgi:hypothetical protein